VSTIVLRPRLRSRVVYFVLTLPLLAIGIVALPHQPVVGVLAILFAGFAAVNGAFRLWHPRSYATELGPDRFRVYDSMGRLVHDVAYAEIARLTYLRGNSLRGPGTAVAVAWRCEPRRPGPGHQPWAHGGRNDAGEEFDGSLPDGYLGIERTAELFRQRIEAAGATANGSRAEPVLRLESF
jgi:hypothetical protein